MELQVVNNVKDASKIDYRGLEVTCIQIFGAICGKGNSGGSPFFLNYKDNSFFFGLLLDAIVRTEKS